MELTCGRCHQTLQGEYRYCPGCGMPQLVYSAENAAAAAPDRWSEAVRDANTVDWRLALRSTLPLAIPAGILCSMVSPIGGLFGLLLMGIAAAWAVALYTRNLRPAWITIRAGARIGMVCGLLAGALAFALSGCELYTERYLLHQGSQIDAEWKKVVDLDAQYSQRFAGWAGMPNAAQLQAQSAQQQGWMMTPEAHSGIVVADFAGGSFFLVLFATAGGALGARRLSRLRRPVE